MRASPTTLPLRDAKAHGGFRTRVRHEYVLLLPVVVFLLLFVAYPVLTVFVRSFTDNMTGQFTLANYERAFRSARYTTAMRNSILFATVCTATAMVMGTFTRLMASRLPRRARNALLSVFSLPLTLSGLVVAFSFIVLAGRNGVVNLFLQRIVGVPRFTLFDLYSWEGLLIVYSFFNIPLMALTMTAVFTNLDRDLTEAARNAGARPW